MNFSKKEMPKKWWQNERELIKRLEALGSQLRTSPKKLIKLDGWDIKRVQIVGKAVEELSEYLRIVRCELWGEVPRSQVPEPEDWYSMAMRYFRGD